MAAFPPLRSLPRLSSWKPKCINKVYSHVFVESPPRVRPRQVIFIYTVDGVDFGLLSVVEPPGLEAVLD